MTLKLNVVIDAWENGGRIPDQYAFCVPDVENHVTLGKNVSPGIRWSGAPEGAVSYALICHDPHVPADMALLNREDVTIPVDASRADFCHWVLVDIPAHITEIEPGSESDAVVPGGKSIGPTEYGIRGINNYTHWFAEDEQMKGLYGGYDGPCPPWNDELVHEYHFTVYALNVASLGLSGEFGAQEVLSAIEGKVIAQGVFIGTYTLNPDLR